MKGVAQGEAVLQRAARVAWRKQKHSYLCWPICSLCVHSTYTLSTAPTGMLRARPARGYHEPPSFTLPAFADALPFVQCPFPFTRQRVIPEDRFLLHSPSSSSRQISWPSAVLCGPMACPCHVWPVLTYSHSLPQHLGATVAGLTRLPPQDTRPTVGRAPLLSERYRPLPTSERRSVKTGGGRPHLSLQTSPASQGAVRASRA